MCGDGGIARVEEKKVVEEQEKLAIADADSKEKDADSKLCDHEPLAVEDSKTDPGSSGKDAAMGDGTITQTVAVGTAEADTIPATLPETKSADDAVAEARGSTAGRARVAPY